MSDIWTFDDAPPQRETPPQTERGTAVTPGGGMGGATRIQPVEVPVQQETMTDVEPPPAAGEEYAVNLGRLFKGAARTAHPPAPPHIPPPPHPPGGGPPGMGHNQGPPMMPAEEAHRQVMETIAPPPVEKEPLDPYTKLIDNLHPIKRAMEGEEVPTIMDPYQQYRLARGSAGKAEHMLRFGTLDFNDLSKVGDSFEDIMKPIVDAGERDEFVSYLKARHALEMEQHGVASGVPLDAAFSNFQHNVTRFEDAAMRMDQYQADVLDYAQKSGLLSEKAVENMRNKWTTYIPMYRAIEGTPQNPSEFNVKNPVMRRKGSEEKTLDPIENVIRNTFTMTEMAERNRASDTFVKYFQARPGQIPLQKVKQPVQPTHVSARETRDFLEGQGIDTSGLTDQDLTGMAVFRHGKQQQLRPGEFVRYVDGKREVWRTDPVIANAITNMDGPELGLFVKAMGAPARALRAGVTLNPAYMLRNIHRDQLTAFVQSKHNYRPLWDYLSGMKSRLSKDEAYQNWLKSGGANATMVAQDRRYDNEFMRKYGMKPRNLLESARRFRPLEGLRQVSEAMENATRIGEFKRATKGSDDVADVMEGGMASRDVTQDFQRRGSATKNYVHMTSFAGGQLQGLDREITNLIQGDAKRKAAVMAKIASSITVPSIALWWANKDDPRYQNENNQVKDRYWLIYPPWDPNLPPEKQGEAIRITKGFTTGIAFSAPTERFLDQIYRERPEAFKDLASSLGESVMPSFVPSALQPIIEHGTNRTAISKFQRPLVPRRFEDRIYAQEQYHPGTSEVAKAAGRGVSKVFGDTSFASPIIIDNYIRGYGGDLARLGVKGADTLMRASGLADTSGGEKAEAKPSDNPIIGTFRQRYPSGGMQPIQSFYEKYEELEKANNTRKRLRSQGRDEEADAIPDLGRLSGIKRRIDKLQKQIRDIQEDRSLNAQQKRQEIDATYIQLLEAAQDGLARMGERK